MTAADLTAHEMERLALEAARSGALILTPTSRLAKRYRHAFRMNAAGADGASVWTSPEIMSLRRWIKASFDALWEQAALAGGAQLLRLWADAVEEAARKDGASPPEGLRPSPALCSRLQDTYARVREHGVVEPDSGGGEMAEWRAKVERRFERLARAKSLLSWHEAAETVRRALLDGRVPVPKKALVILSEQAVPKPLQAFLDALSTRCELAVLQLGRSARPPVPKPPCQVFATPEQECRHACSQALRLWSETGGRASLAIVPLDEGYFPIVERSLDELADRQPRSGANLARFSVAWGTPLPAHPLFQAALAPLRLGTSENPPSAVASLLRSPYTDPDRFPNLEAFLSVHFWEKDERIGAESAVAAIARYEPSLAPLKDFVRSRPAALSEWVRRLRAIWKALGFPWRGGREAVRQQDATAEAQLTEALAALEEHCGGVKADAAGAFAWILALCEGQRVAGSTGAAAGIQVLGPSEAFGLPFDAVWVVGAHGAVLPSARPAEPLLSPSESLELAGGDLQQRAWEDASLRLDHLLALCEDPSRIVFTRAKSEPEGERPYIASPLLEDSSAPRGDALVFDVWGAERDLWLGAPWLRGAAEGLAAPQTPVQPQPDAVPLALESPMAVTALGTLLKCPFQYFASRELGLRPFPEPEEGVPPKQKGILVHEILGSFTKRLQKEVPEWPEDGGEAWDLLKRIASEKLDREKGAHWNAERTRLLGEDEDGTAGIFRAWLEAEREWARKGWRHEPSSEKGERPFKGLRVEGTCIELEGRADRVDANESEGAKAVWDYKTGDPPGAGQVLRDMTEAQIPAYVLALRSGRLHADSEGAPSPWAGPVRAGYISLKKAAQIKLAPLDLEKQDGGTGAFLARWQAHVAARLQDPLRGLYAADPRLAASHPNQRGTACEHCGFAALCGYFDAPRPEAEEDGDT